MALPLPSLPSTPSLPTLPNVPSVKTPKLPVKVTKINVTSGQGVPGGFTAETTKIPSLESAKYSSAIASVSTQIAKLISLGANNPVAAAILKPIKDKLSASVTSLTKKMAATKKAPNFKNPVSVPKLPAHPPINVPKVNIPPLPPAPSVPATPNVSAISSVPKIPSVSTPNVHI